MRFGVICTADIGVNWVIPAIQASDHEVVAMGSREAERARSTADDLGIERAYGSYDALLADEDLDAVYNPLPNGLHAEWTRRAADEGLDVLCEKPITSDARESRELFAYCEEQGVTVMEAFMYHFHPRTQRLREIVREELGEVRYVTSTFTFRMPDGAEDIRLQPELAGGALMDVGCYCVSGIRNLLGEPDRVYAEATDTRNSGVDTQMLGTLAYDEGVTASFACGFDTREVQRIRVETADGWLEAEDCFSPDPSTEVSLTYDAGDGERTETFGPIDHYRLEVEAFADAVVAGEGPPVSHEESVANMETIDALYESDERTAPVDID